ncbi:hypothetical protein CSOJ01_07182 [Colletotrichum sojae]|uniref:Uncharacterized protein n=1 Tax=Colletotrichum sojae TaxID=2175907 RepID=A0A8H6MUU6_9PEZI|nr:hypothetical protein CSOJ01_07182 [Colletotrichum sojae]
MDPVRPVEVRSHEKRDESVGSGDEPGIGPVCLPRFPSPGSGTAVGTLVTGPWAMGRRGATRSDEERAGKSPSIYRSRWAGWDGKWILVFLIGDSILQQQKQGNQPAAGRKSLSFSSAQRAGGQSWFWYSRAAGVVGWACVASYTTHLFPFRPPSSLPAGGAATQIWPSTDSCRRLKPTAPRGDATEQAKAPSSILATLAEVEFRKSFGLEGETSFPLPKIEGSAALVAGPHRSEPCRSIQPILPVRPSSSGEGQLEE